jgi:hypothetical protein
MRKLLFVVAFIIAGPAALSAFTTQASAQLQCPKADTSEPHLSKIRSDCRANCEENYKKKQQPKEIPGCKKSCDNSYDGCLVKYKEWDKKKAECRKPIAACWDKCPKGKENQKCMDRCSDQLGPELGKCAERAVQ